MAREESPDDLPKAPINAHTLREAGAMLAYLRPYRLKLAVTLVLLFLGSVAGLGFPWLSGELVKAAKSQLGGKEPAAWGLSINGVALVLVAVLAAQATMSFFRAILSNEVGEKALADLRRDAVPLPFTAAIRGPSREDDAEDSEEEDRTRPEQHFGVVRTGGGLPKKVLDRGRDPRDESHAANVGREDGEGHVRLAPAGGADVRGERRIGRPPGRRGAELRRE